MNQTDTTSATPQRRYPGPRPFARDDQAVFRGRDREVRELQELLRQYRHLLLHARSGIGKSSLIEAGLLPMLEKTGNYLPFKIIFGAYNKQEPLSPLDAALLHLQKAGPELFFTDKLIFRENSLWNQLKRLQAWLIQENTAEAKTSGKKESTAAVAEPQILLIFDQFEELFTYPKEDILAFKNALAEALFTLIPDRFRETLLKKDDPSLTPEELDLLHHPINLRVLFSIRSDRLFLLNSLTDGIPDILKNIFEIKPLSREQTTAAIVEPAQMPGDFKTPAFEYEAALLSSILDYLVKDQEEYVESFQVQIICKHIEDMVAKRTGSQLVVTKSEVPVLENIFFSFYENALAQAPALDWYAGQGQPKPSAAELEKRRQATRLLVEAGLIFRTGDESGIRLNLYREQIAKDYPEVDDACLLALTRERILRDTPDAAGRLRYELSHDTLVKPILRARDLREREAKSKADIATLRQLEQVETTRKTREIGVSGNVSIDWEYIVRSIEHKRAVLILGENALRDAKGLSFIERFAQSLDPDEYRFIYYAEEQLFGFIKEFDRSRLAYQLRDFSKDDFQIPLLDYLARIPLPLIISFDSSGLLDARLSQNPNVVTDYFSRIKAPKTLPRGNQLIYNLFGSLENTDSLLLTHEDTYEHFATLMQYHMPEEIMYRLNNSEVVLFIGLNLKRSMNQAVLWSLLRNTRSALKIALLDTTEGPDELRFKAAFDLGFYPLRPEDFMEELIGQLYLRSEKRTDHTRQDVVKKNIQDLVALDKLDHALEMLKQYIRDSGNDSKSMDEIAMYASRLNQLLRSYRFGTIESSDAQKERNRITHGILEILDSIFPDQNQSK